MPAVTNEQKLALFASLEKESRAGAMMGKKLNIDRTNGSWSIVSGVSGAFNRRDDDSLTHERVLEAINKVFEESLSEVSYSNLQIIDADRKEEKLTPIVKAYRGYANMIDNGYSSRRDKNNNSTNINAQNLNNSLRYIGHRIDRRITAIACAENTGHFYSFSQNSFFPDRADVEDGKCYGISALWLARYVVEDKKLYHNKTQSENDFKKRMQKKALKILALHHTQNKIDSGGAIAAILDENAIIKPTSFLNLLQNYRNHFNAKPIMSKLINVHAHNESIGIRDAYRRSPQQALQDNIAKLNTLQSSSTVKQKTKSIKFSLGNDPYLIREKKTGYLVSFDLEKKVESLQETEQGGHALALFYSDVDNYWYFIDPNYGEWRLLEHEMKKIFARVIALYTFGYTVKNFEYTKFEKTNEPLFQQNYVSLKYGSNP